MRRPLFARIAGLFVVGQARNTVVETRHQPFERVDFGLLCEHHRIERAQIALEVRDDELESNQAVFRRFCRVHSRLVSCKIFLTRLCRIPGMLQACTLRGRYFMEGFFRCLDEYCELAPGWRYYCGPLPRSRATTNFVSAFPRACAAPLTRDASICFSRKIQRRNRDWGPTGFAPNRSRSEEH